MSMRLCRAYFFITLFILRRDNNNKNNRLDLNYSKGNVLFFVAFFFFNTPAQPTPEETYLYCIFVFGAVLPVLKRCLLKNQ